MPTTWLLALPHPRIWKPNGISDMWKACQLWLEIAKKEILPRKPSISCYVLFRLLYPKRPLIEAVEVFLALGLLWLPALSRHPRGGSQKPRTIVFDPYWFHHGLHRRRRQHRHTRGNRCRMTDVENPRIQTCEDNLDQTHGVGPNLKSKEHTYIWKWIYND